MAESCRVKVIREQKRWVIDRRWEVKLVEKQGNAGRERTAESYKWMSI